ncbi:MAG TPA: polymer-forming cytoskeletal protein [Candidatus Acidoferrum sp.]|jgi:cytoskeletal protein CcmA (bactofilin family)|nr:polymer-forming cytoskeletal protein [Candidatus Acidoferrum sp.]
MSKIYDELKNAEQTKRGPGSHIFAGVTIKGEISGNEDLVLDGTVDGPIKLLDGSLTIGKSGGVQGNVAAKDVIIHGSVTGNVEAQNRVEIKPTGSITGDIATSRIVIDDGARCKGSIEIGHK